MECHDFHTYNNRKKARCFSVFIVLAALFFVIVILNINSGSVKIPVSSMCRLLFLREGSPDELNIVWRIRMPRILMSAMLGGALSLSGFLLQTYFENPIAGPFVLGISSGAKLLVALVLVFFTGRYGQVSSGSLIAAAFAGSMAVTGFIIAAAGKIRSMAGLLVTGIMIGYICSAATDFLITFADDADIVNLTNWSQGSFSGMNWSNVRMAAVVTGITFIITFLMSKPIGAFLLGEAYAQSMGVNVKRFRMIILILSSVFSAAVTAFAGPVSFVGIAVPFLIRSALGTSRPLAVIPASFLGGAVFCMMCDLIARMAFAPSELKISTVTSFFGAPVVIYMLTRRRR